MLVCLVNDRKKRGKGAKGFCAKRAKARKTGRVGAERAQRLFSD